MINDQWKFLDTFKLIKTMNSTETEYYKIINIRFISKYQIKCNCSDMIKYNVKSFKFKHKIN